MCRRGVPTLPSVPMITLFSFFLKGSADKSPLCARKKSVPLFVHIVESPLAKPCTKPLRNRLIFCESTIAFAL